VGGGNHQQEYYWIETGRPFGQSEALAPAQLLLVYKQWSILTKAQQTKHHQPSGIPSHMTTNSSADSHSNRRSCLFRHHFSFNISSID
jgi:hypothetical protein